MVLTTVPLFLPGDERERGVPARQARQASPPFQDVHMHRPGRQLQETGDLLVTKVLGDETKNLALPRRQ